MNTLRYFIMSCVMPVISDIPLGIQGFKNTYFSIKDAYISYNYVFHNCVLGRKWKVCVDINGHVFLVLKGFFFQIR